MNIDTVTFIDNYDYNTYEVFTKMDYDITYTDEEINAYIMERRSEINDYTFGKLSKKTIPNFYVFKEIWNGRQQLTLLMRKDEVQKFIEEDMKFWKELSFEAYKLVVQIIDRNICSLWNSKHSILYNYLMIDRAEHLNVGSSTC